MSARPLAVPDDLPDDVDLRADEVVCGDCHYSHHRGLPGCPTCKELR